jgi:HAD superfamily hydrolase (TIGR01509 family)
MAYEGVLFDWRGTLVRDPDDSWWLGTALARLGRSITTNELDKALKRLTAAAQRPNVIAADVGADCSAERHHYAAMLRFTEAGLDADLAQGLYDLDFEPLAHPMYEDVPGTIKRLKDLDVGVAVVSDIHFDLRPEFEAHGLDGMIDFFVLSFEHGIEKPDPRMFRLATEGLGIQSKRALMVGDRPSRDGGAVNAGIPTLLLPAEPGRTRGLISVLALVEASQ